MTDSTPSRGWLLSRHQHSGPGGLSLVYWLATDSGPYRLEVAGQGFLGFVPQQQQAALRQWLFPWPASQWSLAAIELISFDGQPQCALYCYSHKLWLQLQKYCASRGIPLLESDVRSCDRFLMERRVTAALEWKQGPKGVQLRPLQWRPSLKVVSLDIECSRDGELYSIGLYADSDKRVLMRGAPQPQSPEYLSWYSNEKALLQALLLWFERHDPDVIIGWNVVGFDLKLLQRRAEQHGMALTLGRGQTEPRWQQEAGPGRGYGLEGRVVLDGIDWLKAAFYHYDSYALDNVAQALLGEGKACQNSGNRMAEIEHNFHHDPLALAHYNLMDCELVWRIFEKLDLLAFACSRAQLTGLEMDRLGGSVAAFNNLYLPELHRAGYVAPDLNEADIAPSPGGYVMDSVPGRYRNVLVLDFKSLYPSIIRTFLIDPMGMAAAESAPDEARIRGFRGAFFHRHQHRLPAIIEALWRQRELAKTNNDKPLSQAIKILMNSFYGVLGAAGCRFHDPRLASSITMRGHEIMKTTRAWIEEAGYEVIYGDTDSTFVHVGQWATRAQANGIGRELVTLINRRWQQKLQQEVGLESVLELEFETLFDHFFMPTLRGAETGSKKRYVGAVGDGESLTLVFKGMETVRSDWTPLARQFQQRLYQSWFEGRPVEALIRQQVQALMAGECDELLVYRKRLRQSLESYRSRGPHVIAAEKANTLAGRARYHKGSQIAYIMTSQGAEPAENCVLTPDYGHYLEKQIQPIVEPILAHLTPPTTLERLLMGQLGLF
ncbi:DNA polymerase II [Ferrimonas sp. SCSIO 43195]|uniref:DNA polymerase II n=1 Tax=Ferrimonas sp. SCSIO 43195 TaxID=2822844 RepID=UPI0020766251|nr:DNA polymerase II [Ferrimonas sp. SCSIO 43195]USD36435.1 DNA polymerase II [Ferrimonas sp. SCSIO 43195]